MHITHCQKEFQDNNIHFHITPRGIHMEGLPRKQRERLRRQKELLEAAEEVFSHKGFHDATIQEISEKSEFAISTIYQLFKNKDEMYLALLRMRLEEFLLLLKERINSSKDPVDKLGQFIESKFEYFSENKPFFRLFYNTSFGSRWDAGVGLSSELIPRYKEYLNLVSAIFEEGTRKKLFSGGSPIAMALAIEGMSNAFLSYSLRHENESVPDLTVSTVKDVLLQGILKTDKNRKK